MGVLTRALAPLQTKSDTALVAAFDEGRPLAPPGGVSFEQAYKQGYSANEVLYACLELIADTASEPTVVTERGTLEEPEIVPGHPASMLINNPNPFYSRFDLVGLTQIDLGIAGNSYQRIELSRRGLPAELWRMRPDQVRVIPDRHTYVRGYMYNIGTEEYFLEPKRVIHFRTRDPYNQFYGMPPLLPAFARMEIDAFMLMFVRAFFENAGVPAGMLTLNRILTRQDKRDLRTMFRQDTGGPKGWHSLVVVDGDGSAKYTPVGAGLNEAGVAMPALDEINETRLAGVMRVPQSLVGTRLGNQSAAYANRKADQQHFWRSRQVPEFERLGAAYTRALRPYWPDVSRIRFDLSQVEALAEDMKELHDRVRSDFQTGIIGHRETRAALGYPADVPTDDVFMVPSNLLPTPGAEMLEIPEPEPEPPAPPLVIGAGGADDDTTNPGE